MNLLVSLATPSICALYQHIVLTPNYARKYRFRILSDIINPLSVRYSAEKCEQFCVFLSPKTISYNSVYYKSVSIPLPRLAAARSRRGSDSPPDCHSIPRRRFATRKPGGETYKREPFVKRSKYRWSSYCSNFLLSALNTVYLYRGQIIIAKFRKQNKWNLAL